MPPGRTTWLRVGLLLGMAKGAGHGAKVQLPPPHKPTPLFGITRPWPNTEVLIIAASGVVNPVRGKSNKQTSDTTHNFPRRQPSHTPLEFLPSLSSIAWQPQALHPATSPQKPPSVLQVLCTGPHYRGLKAPTCIQGLPELAGLSSLPLYQPCFSAPATLTVRD